MLSWTLLVSLLFLISAFADVKIENSFGSDGIFNSSSIPFNWEEPSSNARVIMDATQETLTPPFMVSIRGNPPQFIPFSMDKMFTLTGTDSHITQSVVASFLFIIGDDAVLTYDVVGVAPLRKCIFSWTNAYGEANTRNSAQIKLFESGSWEIHVRDMTSSTVRLTVGIYAYQNEYPWDEWQNYPVRTTPGAVLHNIAFSFYRTPVSVCGNGIIEAGESCDGGACCSSQCQFSTGTCRPSVGSCDVAEVCSGTSATCPADVFASPNKICRPKNGSCDIAETCTGNSALCPIDVTIKTGSCQEKALSFCGKKPVQAGSIGYYCGVDPGYFYQCSGGAYASQSYLMRCPGGTQCGCPSGVECSCNGLASPCVTTGQIQQC